MTPDDDRLDELADAILDGTAIDWDDVEAGTDASLIDPLKVLAALANVHRDSAPPERWGHLALIEPLGRGAFGRVYRARDTRLDREVALKILDAHSLTADTRASSIVDEGRLLAQVRHPNVVTIYGAARLGDEVGLWMELVQGRTLQQLVEEGRRVSPAEAIEIGSQLCDAVAAVHAAGLVHRDIKGANVMRSDDGRVVLMDFGTGWEVRDNSHAIPAGTPLYLAPELLAGAEPSVRTDIYAAGVLLFHLLTGRYPVTARALDELKRSHSSNARIDLRALRPDLPAALAEVVERAMAPAPERRYESAAAMSAELRRANRRMSKPVIAAGAILALVTGALLAAAALGPLGRSPVPSATEARVAAVVPVTSAPGDKLHPALSTDGSQVAYAWGRSGIWEIHVTDVRTGDTRRVSGAGESGNYPRWAPDGRSLAFVRGLASADGPQTAVRVVALEGGSSQTLWQVGNQFVGPGLSWSPDGRTLALSARESVHQPFRIMLLDVNTRARQWATDPQSSGGDTLPAFSPDGVSLAYIRSAGSEGELQIVRLDTKEIRRLSVKGHNVGWMTWIDDGRSLVFTSLGAGGRDTLWRIPVSGGEPQPVAGVGEGATAPSAAPHGRLVYLQKVVDSNLYRSELSGGVASARQLASSNRVESSPDISPDGRRIAFTSNRNGSSEIWLADADGANAKPLTTLSTATHPRWSPDGRYLTCGVGLTPTISSASSIYVVDASSGVSRPLTTGPGLAKWPTWAADGRSIYFGSNRSGAWQIWKVSVHGGDPVQVTRDGGFKAWESSDGSFVYYSREAPGQKAIWRMPVAGGEPSLVLALPSGTVWGGEWTVKPNGIYWLNESYDMQIELLSFATGRSVPVIVQPGRYDYGSGFSVSNDGRWSAFSKMDYHGADIMMVETRR